MRKRAIVWRVQRLQKRKTDIEKENRHFKVIIVNVLFHNARLMIGSCWCINYFISQRTKDTAFYANGTFVSLFKSRYQSSRHNIILSNCGTGMSFMFFYLFSDLFSLCFPPWISETFFFIADGFDSIRNHKKKLFNE